jgi:hypothetical protein
MDVGSYNGLTNAKYVVGTNTNRVLGNYPVPLDAYSKLLLGWLSPVELDKAASSGLYTLNDSSIHNTETKVYRLSGFDPKEYWLLENKNNTGYDGAFTNVGMLIWHVDTSQALLSSSLKVANTFNVNDRGLRIVEADAGDLPLIPDKKVVLTSGTFWKSSSAGYGSETSPASVYNNGYPSRLSIYNISAPGTNMSFGFSNFQLTESKSIAAPNPYNPEVHSELLISVTGVTTDISLNSVKIFITTADGRLVRTFTYDDDDASKMQIEQEDGDDENEDAKQFIVLTWDGTDAAGERVGPGLYYYRLSAGPQNVGALGRFLIEYGND